MGAVGFTSGDPRKLGLGGGTMTGPLVLAGAPSQDLQAATKAYVDTSVSSGGGGGPGDTLVGSVGDTPPDTTNWTAGMLWYDTSTESTTVSGTWRRWTGSVFLPTPPVQSETDFPDETNTGIQAGVTLTQVPAEVSSGDGWSYNTSTDVLIVTGEGAVLDGLQIGPEAILDIRADNVTVTNMKINCGGTGVFGIALRSVQNVHIAYCEIGGTRPDGGPDADGTGRMQYGIKDILTDSSGEIDHCQFYDTANTIDCPVNMNIHDNLVHKMGYVDSDHVDCVLSEGSQHVVIEHNTLINEIGQTSAIACYSQAGPSDDVLINNNLVGGGGYAIYCGDSTGTGQFGATNFRVTNNKFTTQGGTWPNSGQFGTTTNFDPNAAGNVMSGNVWYDGPNAGQAVA